MGGKFDKFDKINKNQIKKSNLIKSPETQISLTQLHFLLRAGRGDAQLGRAPQHRGGQCTRVQCLHYQYSTYSTNTVHNVMFIFLYRM